MRKLKLKTFLVQANRLWLLPLALSPLILGASSAYSDENPPPAMESDQPAEAPAAAPATEAEPEIAEPVNKNPHIARALLTSAIVDREPADDIDSVSKDQQRVYFFTELTGLKGKTVTHRWEYQGKIMAEVNFNVSSPQWRCYSSKNILPQWRGSWTVSVVDEQNQVLVEKQFEVVD
jgi:hypothetical protein